jgi:hypothetical protein
VSATEIVALVLVITVGVETVMVIVGIETVVLVVVIIIWGTH